MVTHIIKSTKNNITQKKKNKKSNINKTGILWKPTWPKTFDLICPECKIC